ncbi:rRNA-processing protein UTP23 homolog [Chelonus insularis]|uniref:rRNA-processing protein UTP23 homolog n=1 Tax=Chelonus insularis TaxID=460826 RepID=UPI00158EC86D|nr:rRNA-processing protein UTP23 homolog [Chelonus insularis]
MKVKRLKKVQKNLAFYANNYKFHEPYQVLIDGTFSHAALENKFNIQEQLPKYFQANVKLLTTPCVIMETERLGHKVYGAMLIVKQFAIHNCTHVKNPTTGSKCLRSMIGRDNSSRYIVATQDRELQDQLRKVAGVPIIYLHGCAPTLEPPSEASKEKAQAMIKGLSLNSVQEETIKTLKEKSGLLPDEPPLRKKKKKRGGPNPLSCKKKQKKTTISNESTKNSGKIKKRKRVKIPAHIKEVLKTSIS